MGILPSLVPYFKAFALPTFRERATQKAHADMYYKLCISKEEIHEYLYKHTTRTSLLLFVISEGQKLRSFEIRKTNACQRLLKYKPSPSTAQGLSAERSETKVIKKDNFANAKSFYREVTNDLDLGEHIGNRDLDIFAPLLERANLS